MKKEQYKHKTNCTHEYDNNFFFSFFLWLTIPTMNANVTFQPYVGTRFYFFLHYNSITQLCVNCFGQRLFFHFFFSIHQNNIVCFKNIQVQSTLDDDNNSFFFCSQKLCKQTTTKESNCDHFFQILFLISHTIRYANVVCSISYFYFRFFSSLPFILIEPKSLKGKLHFYTQYTHTHTQYTIVQFIFSITKCLSFPEISLRGQKSSTYNIKDTQKKTLHKALFRKPTKREKKIYVKTQTINP